MVYTDGVSLPLSAKPGLRARLRGLRRRLAAEAPDAAARAAERLPLDRLPPFRVVSGYHALGSELDAGPLLRRLAAGGALIAMPAGSDLAAPLAFRLWEPGDVLVPDAFGVPSPGPAAPRLTPELVVVPVLAFDRRGGRLGQGGGTYDRTLANLRADGRVFVLGLAYAGQEVDEVPAEAHDQRLDAILTERDFIEAEA
jgi:5-formyltetrahydrofolate cyclo-ligase